MEACINGMRGRCGFLGLRGPLTPAAPRPSRLPPRSTLSGARSTKTTSTQLAAPPPPLTATKINPRSRLVCPRNRGGKLPLEDTLDDIIGDFQDHIEASMYEIRQEFKHKIKELTKTLDKRMGPVKEEDCD